MNHLRVVAVLALGLVVGSCQTISEDMPASSFSNLPSVSPVPIVVIQLPQPAPASSLPPSSPTLPPSSGGGGGGGGNPQPSAPTQNEPSNGCWRNNCNPVASIHAHVYYVWCNGAAVDGYRYATEGPWECDIVLDATPKDARGLATDSSGRIDWHISGGWAVVNGSSFTPRIRGGQRGDVTFSATVDGVTSNVTTYTFR